MQLLTASDETDPVWKGNQFRPSHKQHRQFGRTDQLHLQMVLKFSGLWVAMTADSPEARACSFEVESESPAVERCTESTPLA